MTTEISNGKLTRETVPVMVVPSAMQDGRSWNVVAQHGSVTHREVIVVDDWEARADFIQTIAGMLETDFRSLAWMDSEITTAVDAALALKESDAVEDGENPAPIRPLSFRDIATQYPQLRPPIIHGVCRKGETTNVIAPPKVGKSWLVDGLGLSIVTGRDWLDTFQVEQGRVLILDNELHSETIRYRIDKVANAMGIDASEYENDLDVVSLRGCLLDVNTLGPRLLDHIEPEKYQLIILDAFYRAVPAGTDENSNSGIAQVYNAIDSYALHLDCGFVLIHHSTKGNQAGKSVTDVGAGAGSQSRATDAHLILRPHETDGAIVLEGAVRSWAPIKPLALRWEFPVWQLADDLDPTQLKLERPRGKMTEEAVKAMYNNILDTFVHFPEGATKTDIRGRCGQGKVFDKAWLQACNNGELEECQVMKANRQKYPGFKRVYKEDK